MAGYRIPPEGAGGAYKELRRKQLLVFGLAISPVVLFVLLFVGLAVLFGSTTVEELQRASSPDGGTDAVLMYEGGSGAVGWSYRSLYLTPSGAEAEDGVLAIRSSRLGREVQLRWQIDCLLEGGTTLDLSIPNDYAPRAKDERCKDA